MSDIILSDKEQKLYDYIGTRKADITVKLIEAEMDKEFVGALGRLLHLGLIKSEKRQIKVEYGHKWIKCFFVNKEK